LVTQALPFHTFTGFATKDEPLYIFACPVVDAPTGGKAIKA
jgi:hypothetical protein